MSSNKKLWVRVNFKKLIYYTNIYFFRPSQKIPRVLNRERDLYQFSSCVCLKGSIIRVPEMTLVFLMVVWKESFVLFDAGDCAGLWNWISWLRPPTNLCKQHRVPLMLWELRTQNFSTPNSVFLSREQTKKQITWNIFSSCLCLFMRPFALGRLEHLQLEGILLLICLIITSYVTTV